MRISEKTNKKVLCLAAVGAVVLTSQEHYQYHSWLVTPVTITEIRLLPSRGGGEDKVTSQYVQCGV